MAKKSSSSPTYARSYLFKVAADCNTGKMARLNAMQAEWQRLLPIVGGYAWQQFRDGAYKQKPLCFDVKQTTVFGKTPLVTGMKQCMGNAIDGLMKSWRSNAKEKMASIICMMKRFQNGNGKAQQHQMQWLNSHQLWFVPFDKQLDHFVANGKKTKLTSFDQHTSRLLKRCMGQYMLRFKKPRFDNLPMQVEEHSGEWQTPTKSKRQDIGNWFRMSTLVYGKRMNLPLLDNDYAKKFQGEQAKTFTFLCQDNHWYVKVCRTFAKAPLRSTNDEKNVLGIDLGLNNLLATSHGAIYGQGFIHKLRAWDEAFQRIQKGLQNAGEKKLGNCKRYRDFVRRMRGWLKSEVQGAVNRALALGQPHTVVIEALNFHSQEGTRDAEFNRLVRKMGTGIVGNALALRAEEQGFTVVKVNPAYTSQECGPCGFTSRANRKKNKFVCVCCGKRAHADTNGACNMVRRFSTGRVHEQVKHTYLGIECLERWAARMRERLSKTTPGTSIHRGVIGCARAGLKQLEKDEKNSSSLDSLRLLCGYEGGTVSTRLSE